MSNWEQSGPLSPGGQAQLQTELDCLRTPPFLHTLVQLAEIIRINYQTQYFNKAVVLTVQQIKAKQNNPKKTNILGQKKPQNTEHPLQTNNSNYQF